jgi:4-hydroxy-3-methylbut-2-enyl diphosphate reductase
VREPLDVMVVVGGYNSSNTCHLAALVQSKGVPTFHIEDADGVDPAAGTIRHQPIGSRREETAAGWLGEGRVIGITAGASTPNNKVGETVARICALAGVAEELRALTG